jgi:hypothetical protein
MMLRYKYRCYKHASMLDKRKKERESMYTEGKDLSWFA